MKRQCEIPNCGRAFYARGWCTLHYDHWRRNGDPTRFISKDERRPMPRRSLATRFWAKVDKNGPIPAHRPDLGPCWLWSGAPASSGYGCMTGEPGQRLYAHRVAYELLVGPIPDGLVTDHLCRTPLCVNPVHLEPVTQRENVLRGNGPSARQARQTHCQRGHPFDSSNTYLTKSGKRQCRICIKARSLRRRVDHAVPHIDARDVRIPDHRPMPAVTEERSRG